ncbi:MAG: phosphate ABC transporter substrate-binding protein PstS, partial [Verrucomicrobia bacterium]
MNIARFLGGSCSLILLGGTIGTASGQMTINGAGATFPYPIYSKWFDEYAKVDPS